MLASRENCAENVCGVVRRRAEGSRRATRPIQPSANYLSSAIKHYKICHKTHKNCHNIVITVIKRASNNVQMKANKMFTCNLKCYSRSRRMGFCGHMSGARRRTAFICHTVNHPLRLMRETPYAYI